MRIKKIVIQNYRSFDSAGIAIELPDIKKPFSIVGHNNSGKSNFINALNACLGVRSNYENKFCNNDFYLKDTDKEILIEAEVEDPLKSSDAYSQIKEMPIFHLSVKCDDGVYEVNHIFNDGNGKPVFNPRAIARSKKKEYTDEEKELLNSAQRQGAETIWKWKSKIPVYFMDSSNIHNQLRLKGGTLLAKVMDEVKKNFDSVHNKVEDKAGVIPAHVGKPRKEVFDNAIKYLEEHILSTSNLKELIASVEDVVQKQLEIDPDNISLKFGFTSSDSFFDTLSFYLTDHPDKPPLPIEQMGKGFISLFVVALFKAILNTDEGGNIFILEEPETFLHEHFQEYFYKILCELAEKNQVIYTTHSKKFVNLFEPKSIIRIKNSEYLKSTLVYRDNPAITYPDELEGFELKDPDDFPKFMRTLEPNLGNIIFASSVIIVEGPHDLFTYRTILEQKLNFGLNNIAIVTAWGKDPIITIVQLCKRFEIPYFVIHDWDLEDPNIDIASPPEKSNAVYEGLSTTEKGQYTKNHKLLVEAGAQSIHQNKKNLETVLGIALADKGIVSVFEKIENKSLVDINTEFPLLLNNKLLNFLKITI